MRILLAIALLLGLAAAHGADDKKADEKKSSTSKSKPAGKSDQNAAQKAESSIGKWARENKVWGKPRAGDRQ